MVKEHRIPKPWIVTVSTSRGPQISDFKTKAKRDAYVADFSPMWKEKGWSWVTGKILNQEGVKNGINP